MHFTEKVNDVRVSVANYFTTPTPTATEIPTPAEIPIPTPAKTLSLTPAKTLNSSRTETLTPTPSETVTPTPSETVTPSRTEAQTETLPPQESKSKALVTTGKIKITISSDKIKSKNIDFFVFQTTFFQKKEKLLLRK